MMNKPFTVVVTGRPGSGKTTLAHKLAKQIHCPAICRDEFKEGYVHTHSSSHQAMGKDVNRQLSEIFFETVSFILSRQVSIVIEAAFQHKVWQPRLLALSHTATIILVICSVEVQVALDRCHQRRLADQTRERFHGRIIGQNDYVPPEMVFPTLTVDTTNGYEPSLDSITGFILQSLTQSAD